MINIKLFTIDKYSVSHSVMLNGWFCGCITVSRYNHDVYINACFVKTMEVKQFDRITAAIKWLLQEAKK